MLEVQVHAQKLLAAVFEMVITEEAAGSILDSYPELTWLANCLRRCPLPPGWTAADAGQGRLRYINMGTGKSQEESPLMEKFADMGRLMLHWRRSPQSAPDVAAALRAKHEHDLEEAVRARKVWKGPHVDPETGIEFWHCPATGRSAWGDPGMASEFLSRVADRLYRALPVKDEAVPASAREGSAKAPRAEGPASAREATGGGSSSSGGAACAGTLERQAVRKMMAEIAANAVSQAQAQRPPGRHGSRPSTAEARAPQVPLSMRAPVEEMPSQEPVPEAYQEMSERGRRFDRSLREDSVDSCHGRRIAPGDAMGDSAAFTAMALGETDTYIRPECRRRRLDSSERLSPIEGVSASCAATINPATATINPAGGTADVLGAALDPASMGGAPVSPELAVGADACAPTGAPAADNRLPTAPLTARPKSRRGGMDQSLGRSEAITPAEACESGVDARQGLNQSLKRPSLRRPSKPPAAPTQGADGEPTSGMNQSFKMACSRGMNQSFKKNSRLLAAAGAPSGDLAIQPPLGGTGKSCLGASVGSQMGSTALVGQMCAGAIAAAIDDALVTQDDASASMEDDVSGDEQDSMPLSPAMLGHACVQAEEDVEDLDDADADADLGIDGAAGVEVPLPSATLGGTLASVGLGEATLASATLGRTLAVAGPGEAPLASATLGRTFAAAEPVEAPLASATLGRTLPVLAPGEAPLASVTLGRTLPALAPGETPLASATLGRTLPALAPGEAPLASATLGRTFAAAEPGDAPLPSLAEEPAALSTTLMAPASALVAPAAVLADPASAVAAAEAEAEVAAPAQAPPLIPAPAVPASPVMAALSAPEAEAEEFSARVAAAAQAADIVAAAAAAAAAEAEAEYLGVTGTAAAAAESSGPMGTATPDGEDSGTPPSPSLMSICRPLSPGPCDGSGSSRAESPSILVLDEGPRWTANKPLPKPRTPPRSPRGERPVLLGVPEPLSARARCSRNEPPLSARLKSMRGPRPGARRTPLQGGA